MTDTAIFLFCAVVVHPAPPRLREDEKVLAEPADSGDWLTQINWISKIFCAVCERKRSFSQKPQKSQKKIINLLNQINLCEPHIPFCGICAICERIGGFSQKPRKSQKKIIKSA